MAGVIFSCSKCGWPLGGGILGLTSGLGPSAYRCGHCGNVIASDRQEWPQLGAGGQLQFIFMSVVYAAVFGLLYAVMGQQVYRNLMARSTGERPPYSTLWLVVGCVAVAVAVLALQAVRVALSLQRARRGDAEPATAGFWSPASNGFVLAIIPVMVMLGVSILFR
jgi:hypothetical protein